MSSTAAHTEQVVLLAEDGTPIGVADKATVHDTNTPLHLAFSCHVYDGEGRILVTQRALSKRTWPGIWTNSFCGHPAPEEASEDAVQRRARRELGIRVEQLTLALPDFRYRATDASGVVENEICPVYTATTTDAIAPAADEVAAWRWVDPADLLAAVAATPWAFSPWLSLQLPLLYPAAAQSRPKPNMNAATT
ncbi:MAG: isopentenyl-diphosphate Delta-isomerase [Microbacteriaceae bacterium]|nr:MAG: isopentenyl-diphosphate Delta-isomerase [Microbacteriaceae bacterium]